MGVTNASDLNEVLPNRNSFSNLFSRSTIYGGNDPPTLSPTNDGPCEDDPNFSFSLDNGGVSRNCRWLTLNESKTAVRLGKYCVKPADVSSACRLSCGSCTSSCNDDPTFTFELKNGRRKKSCRWLTINENKASTRIRRYCEQSTVSNACSRSCNTCP
jgi:hypothetical protein